MDIEITEQKFRQYFKPYELVSYAHCNHLNGDAEAIYKLFTHRIKANFVYLREAFNCPFIVNDWHNYLNRLKEYPVETAVKQLEAQLKKELGYKVDIFEFRGFRWIDCLIGAKHSEHRKGNAIDAHLTKFKPEQARGLIRDRFMKDLPYPMRIENNVNWLHGDSNNQTKYKLQFFTV